MSCKKKSAASLITALTLIAGLFSVSSFAQEKRRGAEERAKRERKGISEIEDLTRRNKEVEGVQAAPGELRSDVKEALERAKSKAQLDARQTEPTLTYEDIADDVELFIASGQIPVGMNYSKFRQEIKRVLAKPEFQKNPQRFVDIALNKQEFSNDIVALFFMSLTLEGKLPGTSMEKIIENLFAKADSLKLAKTPKSVKIAEIVKVLEELKSEFNEVNYDIKGKFVEIAEEILKEENLNIPVQEILEPHMDIKDL